MAKCRTCSAETPRGKGKRTGKFFCSVQCHVKSCYKIKENGCWECIKSKRNDGYHSIGYEGKIWLAHRLSYTAFKGTIPEDKILCHTCDNRSCMNPDHLYLGDHSTNAWDRQNRNRSFDQTGSNNGRAKLDEDKVKFIRYMSQQGFSQELFADFFGLSRIYIKDVINGRRWKHV